MLGKRQLFIYWRVAAADAQAAAEALRSWQRWLQHEHPALHARLFSRVPSTPGEVTLMETYAVESAVRADGIDAELQRCIEDDGQSIVQRWLRGVRQVEVFDACTD
jgi:hypothetical protein